FWLPFHDDRAARFMSYALGAEAVRYDRPVHLLVDESQWLPDVHAPRREAFGRKWADLIERHCALEAMALGTAYGTIAAYECAADAAPVSRAPVRIVGGATTYRVADRVVSFGAADLMAWPRHDDQRRRPDDRPSVTLASDALRISGTGWP